MRNKTLKILKNFDLSHSILCTKKMIFRIFNLGTFFGVVATFFDEVAKYEMAGKSTITKKGPETAQSARELAPVRSCAPCDAL